MTAVCPHLGFISLEAISFDTPSSLSVTPPPRLVSWSKNQTTEEREELLISPGDVGFNGADIGDVDVLVANHDAPRALTRVVCHHPAPALTAAAHTAASSGWCAQPP